MLKKIKVAKKNNNLSNISPNSSSSSLTGYFGLLLDYLIVYYWVGYLAMG
jgi:hypothetical protein